jgi:hypothetical protein
MDDLRSPPTDINKSSIIHFEMDSQDELAYSTINATVYFYTDDLSLLNRMFPPEWFAAQLLKPDEVPYHEVSSQRT